jgi:Protein of unknown function (DUF1236)
MNHQRNTLLAGIAALALIAGAGAAAGQEAQKNQGPQTKPPQAAQQLNQKAGATMGQGNQAQGGKMGPSAQQQNHGATGRAEPNAMQGDPNGKAAVEQNRQNGNAAQRQNEHNGAAAAQQQNQGGRENNAAAQRERNGLQGLQGNASGLSKPLTTAQRTHIRDTVINAHGAPRVAHVDFDIAVGTAIPRSGIRIIPVPETLVEIEPRWRGFEYFVYEDEVVIVDPNDMRIVAVVPA